ncbi:MAG: response regulator [Elusimicrobia bacterium]|nr:response regulator [Elusimicrobiota bacterium]
MNQRINVLLIEDDPDFALLLNHYVNDACGEEIMYVLETASSLREGLELLARKEFDIALLDLNLPDSQGLATLTRLRDQAPGIPAVVLTNLEPEALDLQAIGAGAQDFLMKSKVDPQQLRRVIGYALERSRIFSQSETLVRGSPDGIMIIDDEGMVLYANPAALTLLNRTLEKIQGRLFEYPLTTGGPCELKLPGPDGERTAEMRLSEVIWRGRKTRLATIRDISELKRLEQARAEFKEQRRMDQLKDKLLDTVSHELRTPLSIIMAAVGNIRDRLAGPLTEDQEEMIQSADRNIQRLTRILNNFLDLSRLESGGARADRQPFDPSSLLREITDDLRLTCKGKNVQLLLTLPPELPPAFADKDMITQVIGNVLDNALRYARERIQVRAEHDGEKIVVSIIDDGRGIPEARREDIFNRFVQLERPKGGDGYKGTGLGLAICREIMKINDGRIWVENVKDWGAGFHVALPLAAPDATNVVEGVRCNVQK